MRTQRTGVMQIRGMKETLHALRGVHRVAFEKAAGEIIGPSAAPVIADAKALLTAKDSVDTGALRDSIGVLVKVKPNKRIMFAIIGPVDNGVDKNGRRPIKYAHLIEFGVEPHSLKKGSAVSLAKARSNWYFAEKAEKQAANEEGYAFEVDYRKNLRNIARNFLVFRDARAGARISKGFPPRAFLRPAWDKNKNGALQEISYDIGVLIEKTAADMFKENAEKATAKSNRQDFAAWRQQIKRNEKLIKAAGGAYGAG